MLEIYESIPQSVEATQWTGGDHFPPILPGKLRWNKGEMELLAGANGCQGWVPVPVGHWLVHRPGDWSDAWPVDPDYFATKYRRVED